MVSILHVVSLSFVMFFKPWKYLNACLGNGSHVEREAGDCVCVCVSGVGRAKDVAWVDVKRNFG